MTKRVLLCMFFFLAPALFSGVNPQENGRSVEIIEKVNAFILDSSYNRSLFVRGLLKKYVETRSERILKLVLVLIDKNDPLYELLLSGINNPQQTTA